MFSSRIFTDEEYALLPGYARAFQCSCDEKFQSKSVSCTPAYLQFSDQAPQSTLKVCVWNKTRTFLEVKVEDPKTDVFDVTYDKSGMFGGAQTTVYVKCTPKGRKMCFDCLRIRVNRDEVISLPLQLFPGYSWFSLPKVIVMPHVTVGNGAEIVVPLPTVPGPEKFFVTVKTTTPQYYDAFKITPTNGILGGTDGIQALVIHYTPKEYVTLVHQFEVNFPGIDANPHEIIIFSRAIPGLESETIMREVAFLESLVLKPDTKKIPEPRMRLRHNSQYEEFDADVIPPLPHDDLTTPAGVVHFLVRKDGLHGAKDIGPLGLTPLQEQKVHSQLEKGFHDVINRERIRQKNIPNLNHKAFPGDEPIENRKELMKQIVQERELQRLQYEESLGLAECEEDLTRTKLKMSNHRSLRRVGEEFPNMTNFSEEEIAEFNAESRKIARELAIKRFTQVVYIIMMRYRVSKRIPKLKLLKQELRRKKAENANQNKELRSRSKSRSKGKKTLGGGADFETLQSQRKSYAPKQVDFPKNP